MPADRASMSPAIQAIFDHRYDHFDREEIPKRDESFYEAFQEHPEEKKILQFAWGFHRALEKKKIWIGEEDLLAGFSYRYTYEATMPIRMGADFDPKYRPSSSGLYHQEADDAIQALHLDPAGKEGKMLHCFADGVTNWVYKHWESGHILPGYERLLHRGFGGLQAEGQAALATAAGDEADTIRALLICNEAATKYIKRYEELAKTRMAEAKPEHRAALSRMAAALHQIASGPARTFFEAVQLLWLTHEMLFVESYPASFSFGRIDQYLYPYYAADVAAGRMTKQEAGDIVDALWIKFGTTLHTYQNITLGGYDEEKGKTACNDVTLLALESSRKFAFEQPQVCFRYHSDLPEEVWKACLDLLETGTGFPAFFGDKICAENKMRLGIPREDARNFGLIGCVEMGIPGKEYGKTEVLRINWASPLERMLQCATPQGPSFPLQEEKDISSITSFDRWLDWYRQELLFTSRIAVDSINLLDQALVDCYPTPFLSVLMEGCYAKGKDVTAGGTIYNQTGISACGMANVVDSLMAIKTLVFDRKEYTLEEMAAACAADFDGQEELLQKIRQQCPHFGNDEDEVDELMAQLIAWYADFVDQLENPRGGKYQLGLYSVEDHAYMGQHTGALPDGKRAGEALANGLSPVQGRDHKGPTAVIDSVVKTDLRPAANGMVLDLKFSPSFLEKPTHRHAIKAMLDTYFALGGVELQMNIVDRDTLLDAQAHPERHEDLVVRVSGFSALFVTLMKTTQDEIIARTEYGDL